MSAAAAPWHCADCGVRGCVCAGVDTLGDEPLPALPWEWGWEPDAALGREHQVAEAARLDRRAERRRERRTG